MTAMQGILLIQSQKFVGYWVAAFLCKVSLFSDWFSYFIFKKQTQVYNNKKEVQTTNFKDIYL